jgi:hypothetical protein
MNKVYTRAFKTVAKTNVTLSETDANPHHSKENKKQAKKKFCEDLKRALDEKPDLKVYVLFCNVSLTAGEKNSLVEHARQKGVGVLTFSTASECGLLWPICHVM